MNTCPAVKRQLVNFGSAIWLILPGLASPPARRFPCRLSSCRTLPFLFTGTKANQSIRMEVPPIRIEIATTISGIEFDECYPERILDELEHL